MNVQFLAQYRKALIVPVVGLILGALATYGFNSDMTVKDVVTALVTMAAVYLIPNKNA